MVVREQTLDYRLRQPTMVDATFVLQNFVFVVFMAEKSCFLPFYVTILVRNRNVNFQYLDILWNYDVYKAVKRTLPHKKNSLKSF